MEAGPMPEGVFSSAPGLDTRPSFLFSQLDERARFATINRIEGVDVV